VVFFLIPFRPQKGTLWWLLHLHAKFQPIPISGLPWECNFYTSVALRSLTRIQPNLLLRCPWTRWIYIPNLNQIRPPIPRNEWAKFWNNFSIFASYSSFCIFCIFGHKMQTHTPIKLKLGTHKGLVKHISIPIFWSKPGKDLCSYCRFLCRKRSTVCHA